MIQQAGELLKGVNVTDVLDAQVFKFGYDLRGLTLKEFSMDYNKSVVRFNKEKPNIVFEFIDFNFDLEFNYSLVADPKFYVDEGPGEIKFAFKNVTVGYGIIQVDGVFQLEVQEVTADFNTLDYNFGGQGDISFLLQKASALVKGFMEQDASATIANILNNAIPLLNGQLMAAGCKTTMSNLTIDWCAMENPRFFEDSVSLIFKGEVRYNDEPIPFSDKNKIPYIIDPSGKAVQLSVADYFLNTTLYSAYNLDLLGVDIRSLSANESADPLMAETFKYFFSGILDHMPKDRKISIQVNATGPTVPHVVIEKGETFVSMDATLDFAEINEQGNRDTFIQVKSTVFMEVDLQIENKFKLATDIKKLKIKGQSIDIDKYDLTNLEDFNSIIGSISGFIRNYLNDQYSGYFVQELDFGFVKIDLNDTRLMERERYIYFDSSPKFHAKIKNDLKSKVHRVYPKERVTYQEKVEAMAELLKFTPLYKSLEDIKKNEQLLNGIGQVANFRKPRLPQESDCTDKPLERAEEMIE